MTNDYPLLLSKLEDYLVSKAGPIGVPLNRKVLEINDILIDRGAIAFIDGELRVCRYFLKHLLEQAGVLDSFSEEIRRKNKYSPRARSEKAGESKVSDSLALRIGGQREVKCSYGFIDVLTETEIIEVKAYKDWKNAVGQIMVYGTEYPSHKKRIHLFGKGGPPLDLIREVCEGLNILVTAED